MFAIKIIGTGLILALGIVLWRRAARNTQRKRLLAEPFKPEWRGILEKNVPLYNRLPADLKGQLEGLINVCQAVTHGNLRQVRNLKTNKQGTVINGEGDKLKVQVEQATEVWDYEDCDEYNAY